MPRPRSLLLLTASLSVLTASPASADQRIVLLDTQDESVKVVGDAARDETLYAIGNGDRPTLTVYRRTPFGPKSYPWVLQDLDLGGAAISRPRPIGRIERRRYSPFDEISPDGQRIAYPASDDRRRINRDTGRGPVSVEIAGLRALEPRRVIADLDPEPALGWSPDNRTLFIGGRRRGTSRDALWSYDLRTRRTTRRAILRVPITTRELSVGRGGRVLYAAGASKPLREAIVVDLAAGTQTRVEPARVTRPDPERAVGLDDPVISPAGDVVAAVRGGIGELELLGLDGRSPTPIALPDGLVTELDWSPSGSVLAVVTKEFDNPRGFVVRFVEPTTGASRVVMRSKDRAYEPRWSADGRWYGITRTR